MKQSSITFPCQTVSNRTVLDYARQYWWSVIFCVLMTPTLAFGLGDDYYQDLINAIESNSESDSESESESNEDAPATASGFGVAVLDTGVE
ncbi:MAG TPA: hypothetical protein DHW07_06990, partial [Gammaproteobacteria bacterium]|nr:hypothetical protein [Gammaproteobacteria bacterium]